MEEVEKKTISIEVPDIFDFLTNHSTSGVFIFIGVNKEEKRQALIARIDIPDEDNPDKIITIKPYDYDYLVENRPVEMLEYGNAKLSIDYDGSDFIIRVIKDDQDADPV